VAIPFYLQVVPHYLAIILPYTWQGAAQSLPVHFKTQQNQFLALSVIRLK
jgi:hypothetical protein